MSTARVSIYIPGLGMRPTLPSYRYGGVWRNMHSQWVWVSNWVAHIVDGTLVYVDEGGWKRVATFVAPSAADNVIYSSLVGGVFSHTVNFSWTSYDAQIFLGGRLHIYLDNTEVEVVGFGTATNHSVDYILSDAYGTTGGSVTAKVAYLPSEGGSTEGILSPVSNAVSVIAWL